MAWHWLNHLYHYHHLLQMKKPLQRLRKPSNHLLLSDIRQRSTTMHAWQIFHDAGMMKTTLTVCNAWHFNMTLILQTVLCQGRDRSGEHKFYFQKRTEWALLGRWGGGSRNLGTLLDLANVDCTGWLMVGIRFFFYCRYHISIVSTV